MRKEANGRDPMGMTNPVTRETALPGRDTSIDLPRATPSSTTPSRDPGQRATRSSIVAMGCFWGAERLFWRIEGVYSTAVGYMGGWTRNPSYEEVSTSRTGHTETVQVVFDPARVPLGSLFATFWENHDPTTLDRQGSDIGTQYRSAIYTTTDAQYAEAMASRDRYQRALSERGFGTISTEIKHANEAGDGVFYYAEEYHQGYLHKNPDGYCNHGFCQVAY